MLRLNKRSRKIFGILLESSNGITGEELAQMMNVSSRTIRSDIKKIQEAVKEYEIKIQSSPNKGYKLHGAANIEGLFKLLYDGVEDVPDIASERVNYIICRLLENTFTDAIITQMDLADEMFIGLSTLKIHFNDVKKQLKKYSVEIVQYKTEGLKLQGQERELRYCISEFLDKSNKSALYQKIFSDIGMLELDAMLERAVHMRNLRLTDIAKANLCIHVALSIQRSKINKIVSYSASVAQKIEENFEYSVAKDIAEVIYQQIGVDVSLGDVYYIAQCLITSKKIVDTGNPVSKVHVKKLVEKILQEVQDKYSLDFTEDEYLIDGLTLHLSIAIARVQFHMNIRNELLETIKKDYPLAFQMGIIAGKIVTEVDHVEFNENEIGYLALHFGAAISRNGIKEGVQQKNVVIVCSAGLGVSVLLKAKIEEYFHNRVNVVKIIPGYEVNQTLLDQIDFVFTTVPLGNIDSQKIIRINHMLKQEDISRIEQVVFSKPTIRVGTIEQFFSADHFYVDKNFSNREECLRFLTDKAISKGLMKETDKQLVFEREKLSSTAIGELTAIPHPLYNNTSSSFISVLILDKPIPWGDSFFVQVVFLLNVEKEKSELWETIFLKLYHYIKEQNGINFLLKNKSYEMFLQEFIKIF